MRTIDLKVLCEGETEKRFVARVMKPHLKSLGIFARSQTLLPRSGGVVSWERLRKASQIELGQLRSHQFVTTMIDLYELPTDDPGLERRSGESPEARVERIEREMASALPSPQFIPYVLLHEFEALLFVDLDALPSHFTDGEADDASARLRRALGSARPEEVNDGEWTAPSKRILQELPSFTKAIDGPLIAARIGLPRLRAACPHFDTWVGRLEKSGGELWE